MKTTLVISRYRIIHWGLLLFPLLFAGPAAADGNTI
jgi:hypothetical protein